jgi:hypothetical protein
MQTGSQSGIDPETYSHSNINWLAKCLSRIAFWCTSLSNTVSDIVILTRFNGDKHLAWVEREGTFRSLSGTIESDNGVRNGLATPSPVEDNGTPGTVDGTAKSLFGFDFLSILIPSRAGTCDQSSLQTVAPLRFLSTGAAEATCSRASAVLAASSAEVRASSPSPLSGHTLARSSCPVRSPNRAYSRSMCAWILATMSSKSGWPS